MLRARHHNGHCCVRYVAAGFGTITNKSIVDHFAYPVILSASHLLRYNLCALCVFMCSCVCAAVLWSITWLCAHKAQKFHGVGISWLLVYLCRWLSRKLLFSFFVCFRFCSVFFCFVCFVCFVVFDCSLFVLMFCVHRLSKTLTFVSCNPISSSISVFILVVYR